MANKEDVGTVAKEMGRTYNSVNSKINNLRRFAGLKKGKFSAEETERMKQAVANNEDYRSVAAELGRQPLSVRVKMLVLAMKGNRDILSRERSTFSCEDDLRVLDKIIPHLKFRKMSNSGFLSQAELMELANELQRSEGAIRHHWDMILHPWLLQHYTGTTGLRIERMLTSLVAERFNDHRGIDWSEILNQHKEFVGHTSCSISGIYKSILICAKAGCKKSDVSLKEVADYAAEVHQPVKESAAKALHREKIILYFKERVAELGINVVI